MRRVCPSWVQGGAGSSEAGRENSTSHSCHGAPQALWAPVDWLPASRSAEPGGQCAAASWLSVHLGDKGRGEESQHRTKGRRESKEETSNPREREDGGKDRTSFQEVSLTGPGPAEGPYLRQAHCSLEGNPRCCPLVHICCVLAPTPLGEELAVLSQLQLQLISIISFIRKLLLQPSHLELWGLQDVTHGGGWRS